MEELGIGRPSTYASILTVLRERDYVRMDKNKFVPEDKGRLVTAFLEQFFARYVEYDFTASLEEKLDEGLTEMLSDLRRLTESNMTEDIERFATALHADLILPEDF